MGSFGDYEPLQPLKSIITTLEEHRRQLYHLHLDHPFSHSVNRPAYFVGMHNGCRKFEQINHLIDYAHLGCPRVVHRKFDPIQTEIVLPVLNGRSQYSLAPVNG